MTKKRTNGGVRKIDLSVRAPSARHVYVAGTFNDWSTEALAMRRAKDGTWLARVDLPPGRHEYKFVVDGQWCCDVHESGLAECAEGCVPNAFGTHNRLLVVE